MQITSETIEQNILRIFLNGRLDVLGAQEIDMQFTVLTATKKGLILVDMSEVSFLASMGIRTLLSAAKALAQRGGHMVLFKPQPNVLDVLKTSGVSQLLPIHETLDDAVHALTSHA